MADLLPYIKFINYIVCWIRLIYTPKQLHHCIQPLFSPKMPNEGLIPSIQRQIRNGIGSAGDTVGNYVNSNGKAIQSSAYAAGQRVDGVSRSVTGSGKSASKSTTNGSTAAATYMQSVGRSVSRQIESYTNYAGRQVGAAGRYVDGSGRAVGGRVGDFGNQIKDKSGARGPKMATPKNPLGLSGNRAV